MKTMRFAAFIAAAMSVFALASCDPNQNGPDGGKTATVLFSIDNATNIYAAPGEATTAEITLVRLEGTEAATYGIKVVDAADGIEIPESISFQKNQNEATISISVPAGQAGDKFGFEIMLTGDNVNDSANSEEGTLRFEAAVYVYEECITRGYVNDYNYVKNKYLGYFKQTIWRMADGLYVFKDFLGCGADLTVIRSGAALSFLDFSNDEYYDLWTYEDGVNIGFAPYKWFDEETGEYLHCYPKGDKQRYIGELCLYFDPACEWTYYYEGRSYDQIILSASWATVENESKDIYAEYSWDAFVNFEFVTKEGLDTTDFSYPEVGIETLIGEGTTELWGLGTTGTSELYKVAMSTGEVYYTIKGWYGGTNDLEIAFGSDGAPYIHSSDGLYNGYTYYYTGRTDYQPYYLNGYLGYDTLTVTDASGTALTSIDASTSSVVITFTPLYGPVGYSSGAYSDMTDTTYTAWKFTYPAAQ